MKKLSDELLNKYIDGDLDESSLSEVKEYLSGSEENRRRLRELQAIHQGLKNIKEYKVRDNFTASVMMKIKAGVKLKKNDRRFIVFISSVLLILSLGIIVYAFYLVLPEAQTSAGTTQSINTYADYFEKFLLSLTNFFNSQNVSIIGSVFSLFMLISGYFFFEAQKSNKKSVNKFN